MGDGAQIKENSKSLRRKDEAFFCGLLETLVHLDERSLQMLEVGVDLTLYEDPLHKVIEGLVYKHYGEVKAQIIMWWVLAIQEKNDGNTLTLKTEDSEEHVVNTPKQLYRVLKKLKL